METWVAKRREAALTLQVASKHTAARMEITEPLFNLREITKQMLLLEDHLAHPYKLCQDCIRKHLMTIEALAEESSSMDSGGTFVPLSEALAEKARVWIEVLADGAEPRSVGVEMRGMRKKLVPLVFDPREAAARVASVYVRRGICPHND